MRRFAFAYLAAIVLSCGIQAAPKVEHWNLPTGSHIASLHFSPAQKPIGSLIYVHGGPGATGVASAVQHPEMFAPFVGAGFDVIVYDQIGSGRSARLADPRQYTVARHVADLEAVRKRTGAAHPAFIGESWGSTLLANYMAAHPGIASKVIFLSPGPIDPAGAVHHVQIPSEFMTWIRQRHPDSIARFVTLNVQLKREVTRAHQIAPDGEMDPLLDEFVNDAVRPQTVFDRRHAADFAMHGMGWWSYVMTNHDLAAHPAHPQNRLASDRTPVLVLRGEADYVPLNEAKAYAKVFPNAKFVNVPRAGHIMWLEQAAAICKAMQEFLLDRSS